jgi:intergrase/recombinase
MDILFLAILQFAVKAFLKIEHIRRFLIQILKKCALELNLIKTITNTE